MTLNLAEEESNTKLIGISDLIEYELDDETFYGELRSSTEFKVMGNIGDGSTCTVFKVQDSKENRIAAMKLLKKSSPTPDLEMNTFREVTILKSLEHDNIIKLYEISLTPGTSQVCLILEYCQYSLDKLIDSYEKEIPTTQLKCIAKQLFCGLDYLHKNYIMHRDLTTSNCLISLDGKLKISDFGLCRRLTQGRAKMNTLTPVVITRWYRPPEILLEAPTYGMEADLWSAGCIFAELLQRKPLFRGESDIQQISLIVDLIGTPNSSVWPGFSKCKVPKSIKLRPQPLNRLQEHFKKFEGSGALDILCKLVMYNPLARLSAEDCIQHDWIERSPFPDPKINLK